MLSFGGDMPMPCEKQHRIFPSWQGCGVSEGFTGARRRKSPAVTTGLRSDRGRGWAILKHDSAPIPLSKERKHTAGILLVSRYQVLGSGVGFSQYK